MQTKPFKTALTEKQIARFWSNVEAGEPDKCWPWKRFVAPDGYGMLCILGRVIGPHRIAWIISNKRDSYPLIVRHSCDNRPCCNPAHLLLGTMKDNAMDKVTRCRGIKKLNKEQVNSIRELLSTQMTQREVALKFGICQQTVSDINRRLIWDH